MALMNHYLNIPLMFPLNIDSLYGEMYKIVVYLILSLGFTIDVGHFNGSAATECKLHA